MFKVQHNPKGKHYLFKSLSTQTICLNNYFQCPLFMSNISPNLSYLMVYSISNRNQNNQLFSFKNDGHYFVYQKSLNFELGHDEKLKVLDFTTDSKILILWFSTKICLYDLETLVEISNINCQNIFQKEFVQRSILQNHLFYKDDKCLKVINIHSYLKNNKLESDLFNCSTESDIKSWDWLNKDILIIFQFSKPFDQLIYFNNQKKKITKRRNFQWISLFYCGNNKIVCYGNNKITVIDGYTNKILKIIDIDSNFRIFRILFSKDLIIQIKESPKLNYFQFCFLQQQFEVLFNKEENCFVKLYGTNLLIHEANHEIFITRLL